jgi:hypothetical protein
MGETGKTTWECRVALARLGIHTTSGISLYGIRNESGHERAYGLWGRTWYWNGLISDVCFHDHAIIDLREEEHCIAQIRQVHERVLDVFQRGLQDFPDSIPCLSHEERPDGRLGLVESEWNTKNAREYARKFYPTENIPLGAEVPASNEALLRAQLENARNRFNVEDSLDTYTGRVRYIGDCQNRDWQFKTKLVLSEYDGIKLSCRPRAASIDLLSETVAADLARTTGASLMSLFADYGKGGRLERQTGNGLPPGFLTLDEYRVELERRAARMSDPEEDLSV